MAVPGQIYISTTACLVVGTFLIFIVYRRKKANTFKRNGIPGPPTGLLGGTDHMTLMMKLGYHGFDQHLTDTYGKVVGFYQQNIPTIIVSDLDMLKDIMVKDFDRFQNRTQRVGLEGYAVRKILTRLDSEHWKHARKSISPVFSGSKLRRMVDDINRCCHTLASYMLKKCENDEVVEMREASAKFAMDVIASTTYGIETDSASEDNNQFYMASLKLLGSFSNVRSFKMTLFFFAPWLLKLFHIDIMPKDTLDMYMQVFTEALEKRKHLKGSGNGRNFVEILADKHIDDLTDEDVKKDNDVIKTSQGFIYSKKGLTHEEILSQSLVLFMAAFDTVASGVAFILFNLACYPEIQEKLYNEITKVMGDKEEPDYDTVKEMPYLLMCIEESMRLYPPAVRADRRCTQDTQYNGYTFRKGWSVPVPVYVIHHDPTIWENPEEFRPERFTPEEKAARHPMAYLPFGMGPRHCVAKRLALLEVKLVTIQLLRKFKLVICKETQFPLVLDKFRMAGEKGLKIKFEKR